LLYDATINDTGGRLLSSAIGVVHFLLHCTEKETLMGITDPSFLCLLHYITVHQECIKVA